MSAQSAESNCPAAEIIFIAEQRGRRSALTSPAHNAGPLRMQVPPGGAQFKAFFHEAAHLPKLPRLRQPTMHKVAPRSPGTVKQVHAQIAEQVPVLQLTDVASGKQYRH